MGGSYKSDEINYVINKNYNWDEYETDDIFNY